MSPSYWLNSSYTASHSGADASPVPQGKLELLCYGETIFVKLMLHLGYRNPSFMSMVRGPPVEDPLFLHEPSW